MIILMDHEVNSGFGTAIFSGYKWSLELGVDVAAVVEGINRWNLWRCPSFLIGL